MMTQLPVPIDVDAVLRQICDSLLLLPARDGAVKIVIESEAGEEIHVLRIASRSSPAQRTAPTFLLRPEPPPFTFAPLADKPGCIGDDHDQQQLSTRDQGLLQRCEQQQRRITELEQRLHQVQQELLGQRLSPAAQSADQAPLCPTLSTDDDSSSSGGSSSSDSPRHSSGGETEVDGHAAHDGPVTMVDGADDASQSSTSSQPASGDSSAVRRSERAKTNVERWRPATGFDAARRPADPSSSHKKRQTERFQRSVSQDDGAHNISSAVVQMEVDSMDGQAPEEAAEVAALVAKLREGYDSQPRVALDSLSKESLVSLRQQVLTEEGHRVPSLSGQITALISTSTSLKMVGYFLRAIFVGWSDFGPLDGPGATQPVPLSGDSITRQ
jgi:hypothetical protein